MSLIFDSSDFRGKTFPNFVEVGGEQIIVNNTARTVEGEYTRTSATIPAALLTPGENTIRIAAGGSEADCGTNFDDFNLKNVSLQLRSGEVLDDNADTGTVSIGDGSCGSNTSRQKHHDYTFTLPGEGSGINWDLDTTKLADGQHALSAKTDGGGAVSSRITVDNTAPVIDSVSISEGELLKGSKRLEIKAADAVTEVDISAELDGEPVDADSVVDSDVLYLGSLELVVTATDAANNTTSHTITFNSVPERPVIDGEGFPLDGATGISTRPTLRSTWMDPTRKDITVDFHEAVLSAPSSLVNGDAKEPGSVKPAAGTDKTAAAKAVDGTFVDSVSSQDVPYQQFGLPVADKAGDYFEARWDGVIDQERDAVLLAWNMKEKSWKEIGRKPGQPDGNTTVRGTVSHDFVDAGSNTVHLMVKGTDPFRMVASDKPNQTFKDPSGYTFAMSWMTDTQYLSEGATDPGEDNQVPYQNAFAGMTNWIVDNADQRKIAYSAHTGDIAENWNNGDGTNEAQKAQDTRLPL